VDHATTMRRTYELISAGDVAGFGDLVADDFVDHDDNPGFAPDKAGTLDFFRAMTGAFPDLTMVVEDLIADGDKSVARVRLTGTHRGELMGIPPTGASGDIQLIDIMRFDAYGRVCEHWGVADMLSLMQQLGVVPDGAPA
jgi:steroid delta-isomerase-like uncharacterized protein